MQTRDLNTRLVRTGDFASRIGSLRPSDPNLRRGIYAALTITVLLGVGLAGTAAIADFSELEWQLRPAWIAVGVLGFTAVLLCNAEIWRLLLGALGPVLGRRRATAIWCTSTLGRYVPASVLLPIMRTAMAEREGVPKRICLASIVYELVLALTAALIVGAYLFIDLPDLRGQPWRFLAPALAVLAIVVLQPQLFHRLVNFALERLGRDSLPVALESRKVFEFVGLYTLSFTIAGISVYALAAGVYPLGGDDLVPVIGAFGVATALSVIAFMLPGGVVAREAGLAIALSPVMPTAAAIGVAALVRIVQLCLEVLLAVVTPIVARSEPRSSRASREHPRA